MKAQSLKNYKNKKNFNLTVKMMIDCCLIVIDNHLQKIIFLFLDEEN